ncbi:MAG: phosphate ABC transporter permease PstA [Deltaproteobacteria bacterium]|nr:phosphate ABC transporter permease PstA [Nannocystaceae bacterium]
MKPSGPQLRRPNRALERAFELACVVAVLLPVLMLAVLLLEVAQIGLARLDLQFVTSYASRDPGQAGILAGIVGSLYLVGLTAIIAVPLGIGSAVYLEEYARPSWLSRLVEINISNLAGVPSVIYGLLGLELFVRALGLGRSLLAGALTLALLVVPIVMMAAREALRAVPREMREAGLALGGTPWQVVRTVVLPMSLPGMLTGSILAISRALGEAAPLVVLGAVAYVDFLPDGVGSEFTALPIQIFNWTRRPQAGFVENAGAGIIVLIVTLLVLNAFAIVLRNRLQGRQLP